MTPDEAYELMAREVPERFRLKNGGTVEELVARMKADTNVWSLICAGLYSEIEGGWQACEEKRPDIYEAINTIKDTLVFEPPGDTLVFKFDNQKMASHFKHWLCGQGEQDYWLWMEYREQEEGTDPPITAQFDHHRGETINCKAMPKEDG